MTDTNDKKVDSFDNIKKDENESIKEEFNQYLLLLGEIKELNGELDNLIKGGKENNE